MLKILGAFFSLNLLMGACYTTDTEKDPYKNLKNYPNYGGTKSNARYSSLKKITHENINPDRSIEQENSNDGH